MTGFRGEVNSSEAIARGQLIINYLSTGEDYVVDFTDDFFSLMRLTLRSTWPCL